MKKSEIRKIMLQVRNKLSTEIRKHKSTIIINHLTNLLLERGFRSILLYASFGSEVDTWGVFEFCLQNSIKTAYPKVRDNELELYWVESKEQLTAGFKGIPEPTGEIKVPLEQIDVIAVPGVAFDVHCFRIGYGGGYYDRLLSRRKGLAIGLAYDEQILDRIPSEPFDQRVDLIITDKRFISCV